MSKITTIKNVVECFKTLDEHQKMYILGIMQGIILSKVKEKPT